MSFESNQDANVVDLTRYRQEKDSGEFANMMTPVVVNGVADLGLADEFLGILGRHINDLEVVFDQHDRVSHITLDSQAGNYQRLAIINTKNRLIRANQLTAVAKRHEVNLGYLQALQLSTELCFFELCADVVGNACYMQRQYDKYVSQTNLQDSNWRAEYTVAETYMKEVASDDLTLRDVRTEHAGFRSGLALSLLENSLVRYGFTDSASKAAMIVNSIRKKYVFNDNQWHKELIPHTAREISERLLIMKPRKTSAELAAYVLALGSLDDFNEFED